MKKIAPKPAPMGESERPMTEGEKEIAKGLDEFMKEDWKKSFDKNFPFAIIDWKIGKENDGDGIAVNKMTQIKSFINQLLISARSEEREKYKKNLREKIESKLQDEKEHPANSLWNIAMKYVLENL